MSKKLHEGEQGVIPGCKSSLMISIGDVWPVDRLLLRFGQIYTPRDEERSECFWSGARFSTKLSPPLPRSLLDCCMPPSTDLSGPGWSTPQPSPRLTDQTTPNTLLNRGRLCSLSLHVLDAPTLKPLVRVNNSCCWSLLVKTIAHSLI